MTRQPAGAGNTGAGWEAPQRGEPFVVAGPCSVESRGQLRQVVEALMQIPQVKLVRAGVWKPRTRPGGFEGLGEPALQWMQELTTEKGVAFCCEVARPEHVELCLQYGVHTMWIGARTTENPFMVGELCEAMRGSDVAVMVKNPMCPDVGLWVGAIERLWQVGVQRVAAIHRGFSTYTVRHSSRQGLLAYRNEPLWEVALELRGEMPEVPILCDPSHIGGRKEWVEPLLSTAMQLAYDGAMIEVHPSPSEALTDANQQLSPNELAAMLGRLAAQQVSGDGRSQEALAPLRQQIDEVDHEMIGLLARRMSLSQQIAHEKQRVGLPAYQSKRWESVMADRLQAAMQAGLDPVFVREMFEKVHAESLRVQLAAGQNSHPDREDDGA